MEFQVANFAGRGLKGEHLALRSHFARCEQRVVALIGADIEDGHAGLEKLFNESVSFVFVGVLQECSRNLIIAQQPPSAKAKPEGKRNPRKKTKTAKGKGAELAAPGLSGKFSYASEQRCIL